MWSKLCWEAEKWGSQTRGSSVASGFCPSSVLQLEAGRCWPAKGYQEHVLTKHGECQALRSCTCTRNRARGQQVGQHHCCTASVQAWGPVPLRQGHSCLLLPWVCCREQLGGIHHYQTHEYREVEEQQKVIFLFLVDKNNCIKCEAIRIFCVEI